MLVYSIIMFLAAALLLAFSIAIYKGRTNLIHDYHQKKVTDKPAYGRAFGKALAVVALAPLVSGLIGLFAASRPLRLIAVAALIVCLCAGVGCLVAVQKKYNKGVF